MDTANTSAYERRRWKNISLSSPLSSGPNCSASLQSISRFSSTAGGSPLLTAFTDSTGVSASSRVASSIPAYTMIGSARGLRRRTGTRVFIGCTRARATAVGAHFSVVSSNNHAVPGSTGSSRQPITSIMLQGGISVVFSARTLLVPPVSSEYRHPQKWAPRMPIFT